MNKIIQKIQNCQNGFELSSVVKNKKGFAGSSIKISMAVQNKAKANFRESID